jgi:small conductance mechanosensitive channel
MDSAAAWQTVHDMLHQFSALLPRLIFAVGVAIVFYVLSVVVKVIVRRTTSPDAAHRTLRIALGRVARGIVLFVGFLLAVTVAFPGFTPANLVSALGVGGIAIGFAFKDIFENFFAGILILFSRPFRIGDQIIYDHFEGTVEEIQTRATWLKTYDGRRILIPNSELFKNSVTVNTAFDTRRLEYDFKIGADEDVEKAKNIIIDVMRHSQDVLPDPKADIIVINFDPSSVTIRARWWSKSKTSDVLLAQDRVLMMTRKALRQGGVSLPSTSSTVVINPDGGATAGPNHSPAANGTNSRPAPVFAKDQ